MRTTQAPNPAVDAWLAAADLAERLRRGSKPPTIASPVALRRGERLHAHAPVQSLWFGEVDATYTEDRRLAFGGFVTLALTATASALLNRSRRAKAEALAAPQWRPFGNNQTLVTNDRLLIGDGGAGTSVWYPTIRQILPAFNENRVDLIAEGHHPYRLQGPWAPYLAVLIHHIR